MLRTALLGLDALLELGLHVDARGLVHYVPVGHSIQLTVRRLQNIAARHRRRVIVPQLILRLLPRLDILTDLAFVASAAPKDSADVAQVRNRIVLTEEAVDLIVSTRLINTLYRSERIVVVQVGVALHIRCVNVSCLWIHDIRGRVQVLERVHATLVLLPDLGTRGRHSHLHGSVLLPIRHSLVARQVHIPRYLRLRRIPLPQWRHNATGPSVRG